jgi:hypothetical protein
VLHLAQFPSLKDTSSWAFTCFNKWHTSQLGCVHCAHSDVPNSSCNAALRHGRVCSVIMAQLNGVGLAIGLVTKASCKKHVHGIQGEGLRRGSTPSGLSQKKVAFVLYHHGWKMQQ